MNRKLRNLLFSCSLLTSLQALTPTVFHHPASKFNEVWWEKNIGNLVSYETFEIWLGDIDAPSRQALRQYLKHKEYKTMLEAASGLGIDYLGFKREGLEIEYTGIDITPKLVDYGRNLNIPVMHASVENIPFGEGSFDLVYVRHLLEHLPTYRTALTEMIRVAKQEVVVIFFIPPTLSETDAINSSQNLDCFLFNNEYSLPRIEAFLLNNPKVKSIHWEEINTREVILHVYL